MGGIEFFHFKPKHIKTLHLSVLCLYAAVNKKIKIFMVVCEH